MDDPSSSKCCTALVSICFFILFVFTCVSLTQTDKEEAYSVCGHSLRNMVIADLVYGLFGSLSACVIYPFLLCCFNGDDGQRKKHLKLVVGMLLLILGGLSIHEYVEAKNMPGCFDALRTTTSDIESPGDPLLAKIVLIYGCLYTVTGSVSTIALLLALCGCLKL